MNNKTLTRIIPAFFTIAFSSFATAATFNFADIADNSSNPNYYQVPGRTNGEYGANPITATDDGITVTATGSATNDDDFNVYAYLDANNAGLGVCKDLNSNFQCDPSNDDNVTFGETLLLDFGQTVKITDLWFVNGRHGTNFSGDVDISIDGGTVQSYSLTNHFIQNLAAGTTFAFSNNNSTLTNPNQFYINTMDVQVVPLPAAAWLFMSGLFSLGFLRKKENS